MSGPEFSNVLLAALGVLLTVIWWSIRKWMERIDVKLDRMEIRQATTEKDCVTWPELEKVTLRVNEHDRRLAVVETTCHGNHGK